jgi:ATP-binding cassette subfamily C protein
MQTHYLGRRVLEAYLYRPYEYFLSQNSSDLSKVVLGEVGQLVGELFIPALTAFGRICTAIAIILMLIVIDLQVAIVMALVMGFFYVSIYKAMKNTIDKVGASKVAANQKRFRLINEASGGIKEVKLMNKEAVYLEDFSGPSRELAKGEAANAVIGDIPKYVLETIAFGGMLSVVIYLIATEGQSKAISLAALYAFAGYKLMPALQQVFLAATTIRFNVPVLSLIEKSLSGAKPTCLKKGRKAKAPLKLVKELRLENLSFRYIGATSDTLRV